MPHVLKFGGSTNLRLIRITALTSTLVKELLVGYVLHGKDGRKSIENLGRGGRFTVVELLECWY